MSGHTTSQMNFVYSGRRRRIRNLEMFPFGSASGDLLIVGCQSGFTAMCSCLSGSRLRRCWNAIIINLPFSFFLRRISLCAEELILECALLSQGSVGSASASAFGLSSPPDSSSASRKELLNGNDATLKSMIAICGSTPRSVGNSRSARLKDKKSADGWSIS